MDLVNAVRTMCAETLGWFSGQDNPQALVYLSKSFLHSEIMDAVVKGSYPKVCAISTLLHLRNPKLEVWEEGFAAVAFKVEQFHTKLDNVVRDKLLLTNQLSCGTVES